MKILLYCCKEKPYLYKTEKPMIEKKFGDYHTQLNKAVLNDKCLNGKIVAECDFEVEEIEYDWYPCDILPIGEHYYTYYHTKSISTAKEFYSKSCLDWDKLNQYLNDYDSQKFEGGYAIHIKNLHIFNEPKELSVYYNLTQNDKPLLAKTMQKVGIWEIYDPPVNGPEVEHFVVKFLIPVHSEELRRILNKEQTVLVRKRVLKEMLK